MRDCTEMDMDEDAEVEDVPGRAGLPPGEDALVPAGDAPGAHVVLGLVEGALHLRGEEAHIICSCSAATYG